MICPYCEGLSLSQSRFYQITNVKERFIPTYYHHPIFQQAEPAVRTVRCSPTYHSKVLHFDGGYQCQKQNGPVPCGKIPKSTYRADFRRAKEDTFKNYKGNNYYNSHCGWYDEGKGQVFCTLNEGQGYSRQRKMVDLASSNVFDGFTLEPKDNSTLVCGCCAGQTQKQQKIEEISSEPDQKDVQVQVQQVDLTPTANQKVAEPSAVPVPHQQTQTFGHKKGSTKGVSSHKRLKKPTLQSPTQCKPTFTVIHSRHR